MNPFSDNVKHSRREYMDAYDDKRGRWVKQRAAFERGGTEFKELYSEDTMSGDFSSESDSEYSTEGDEEEVIELPSEDAKQKPKERKFRLPKFGKERAEEENEGPRLVHLNKPDFNAQQQFVDNYVRTTKYRFWNFLPKNLFEQFRRVANIYFLIIALVTLTPVSPVSSEAFIIALVVVLGATAIKEAMEDWRRYQSDKSVNARQCGVLRARTGEDYSRNHAGGSGQWERLRWDEIRVGDIVRVRNWQPFPADLLLLSSSNPTGQCYIETSNLDGETNLKIRQACKETMRLQNTSEFLALQGIIACSPPNEDLYKFDGSLTLTVGDKTEETPLDTNQLLLRGSILRNTNYIVGLVLYTGHETKYMLSTSEPPSKRSRVEKLMNKLIIISLVVELVLVVASAILGGVWQTTTGEDMWYLDVKDSAALTMFMGLFTFLVLYSPMVPISLYVTIEFVRVIQAYFIEEDDGMYYEENNTRAMARTSNLNEELGQIDYVFSDKTGTLTSNQMIFRVCSVGGEIYGKIPVLGLGPAAASSPASSSTSTSLPVESLRAKKRAAPASPAPPSPRSSGRFFPAFFRNGTRRFSSSVSPFGSIRFPSNPFGFGESSPSSDTNRGDDDDDDAKGNDDEKKRKTENAQQTIEQKKAHSPSPPSAHGSSVDSTEDTGSDVEGEMRMIRRATAEGEGETEGEVTHEIPLGDDDDDESERRQGGTELRPMSSKKKSLNDDEEEEGKEKEERRQHHPQKGAKIEDYDNAGNPAMIRIRTKDVDFEDGRIFDHIEDEDHLNSQYLREFLTALAVCHTVIPEEIDTADIDYDRDMMRERERQRERVLADEFGYYSEGDDEDVEYDEEGNPIYPRVEREHEGDGSVAQEEDAMGLSIQATDAWVLDEDEEDFYYPDRKRVRYQAASPDEAALVAAAKHLGFFFHTRTHNTVTVSVMGRDETFEVLNVLEFTSNRKRMSVIVRTPTGEIKLYCKGADNVIYERLAPKQKFERATAAHLHRFACAGLRTLCVAKANIDASSYAQWNARFRKAQVSLVNRKAKLARLAEEVEVDLELLGATGIEDRLQDGVPEAIQRLVTAGIKVWVLTGDKRETAINVGKACNLLKDGMIVLQLTTDTKAKTKRKIDQLLHLMQTNNYAELEKENALRGMSLDPNGNPHGAGSSSSSSTAAWGAGNKAALARKGGKGAPNKPEFALVIEGKTLSYALEDDLKLRLLSIAQRCHTVVCCRTSPLQKTLVVRLVRECDKGDRKDTRDHIVAKKVTTLAIGDGANDVPMIQEAHVGIGISGREGMQAVLASDYAIAQFRFLTRLLFVHGRYSYKRMSLLVLYFFYKNLLISLINLWWSIFAGFSGQTIWDSYSGIGFNLVFTALPIIIVATMDKDVPEEATRRFPYLYRDGQTNLDLNTHTFVRWMLHSAFASLLVFAIPAAVFDDGIVSPGGKATGLWEVNVIIYTCCVIISNAKLALETNTWTWIHHVALWSSIASYFVLAMVYMSDLFLWLASDMYWVIFRLLGLPAFYLTLLVTCVACLLPDFAWKAWTRNYDPENFEVVQEVCLKEAAERAGNKKNIFSSFVLVTPPRTW